MKFLSTFIFLAAFSAAAFVFNAVQPVNFVRPGNLPLATVGDGTSSILVGSVDSSGNFQSMPEDPAALLSGMVFGVDTNGFSVINGTLYSRGLGVGGTYPALVTNLASLFSHFSFVTNNRVILGTVPSVATAQLLGVTSGTEGGGGPPTPVAQPALQFSTDGGSTWSSQTKIASPCLVSIYDPSGYPGAATGLVVTAYVNTSIVGGTNDLQNQSLWVTQTADARSVVNVSGAASIAAAAAANWSIYPATSAVNLGGNPLVLSPAWTAADSGGNLIYSANGTTFLTLTPPVVAGAKPIIQTITKTGTNLTFKLTAATVPTIQVSTNLSPATFANLSGQTNWQNGDFWFVSALCPQSDTAFFRASVAGTNTAAGIAAFAGKVTGNFIFTNAAGAKFSLVVNSATNGFAFIPQ